MNSIHHQSIDELGSSLRVSARADDGVIEAIEFERPLDRAFFLGLQWHPEWIPDDPASQRLYSWFIHECAK